MCHRWCEQCRAKYMHVMRLKKHKETRRNISPSRAGVILCDEEMEYGLLRG